MKVLELLTELEELVGNSMGMCQISYLHMLKKRYG